MNLDSFDIAHVIYSVLLIGFLLLSLIGRRDLNMSNTIKYIAIWSAIALLLVIGYSYRHQFGDVKSRVMGELHPSSTQVNAQQQIVIYRAKNGHFYINSEVNGHFVRFMIDTGASSTSLSMKDATRLGINTNNLHFNQRYQTANGPIFAATAYADRLKLGHIMFKDVPVSIAKSDIKTPLLGINILRQFTKYEVSQDRLILTP